MLAQVTSSLVHRHLPGTSRFEARERVDDAQTQLLPLLRLVDRDVLDVAHRAEVAQELALEEDVPFANEGALAKNELCASADKTIYALVANPNTKNLKVRSGSYGSRSSCGLRVT